MPSPISAVTLRPVTLRSQDSPLLRDAYRHCEALARAHAENFPVASRLLPAEIRLHLAAFYAFARTADDHADEPDDAPAARDRAAAIEARRRALRAWRARLHEPAAGDPVVIALAATRRAIDLGPELFERLLDAFERDLDQPAYDDWDDLLTYCRNSAEPVGRLVLAAAGDRDPGHADLADRICTALQLTNFWQDLSRDEPRGRFYLPRHERRQWGDARALAYAVARTRRLFDDGAPLARTAPRALRPWLRAVLAGGRTVLARVESLGSRAFVERPALGARDRAGITLAAFAPGRFAHSSFAASFRLLAPSRRDALEALHAFCRTLDDEVDDAPDLETATFGFARASREVERMRAASPRSPAGRRLLDSWRGLDRVDGSRELLFEGLETLLEGIALDAVGFIPHDDDALEAYCRAVGGGPGLAALPVFGRTDARVFALALGVALQRTNVLRDVAADARTGRCYVPLDELAKNGLTPAALAASSAPSGYRRLVDPLLRRARAAYARARSAVPPGAASDLAPALAMGRVYEAILARIEADPGRVYRERVRVPSLEGALHLWLASSR